MNFVGDINEMQVAKFIGKVADPNVVRNINRYTFEGPIIYANMLLELVGYTCVYVKERNNTDEFPLFEYHNIEGMNGIEPILDNGPIKSIRKDMPGEEKKKSYNKRISDLEKQRKNIKNKIEKCEEFKKNLNDKNPKKMEEEKESESIIKTCTKKYEETEKKIAQTEIRKKEYDNNYTDSSEFFKHIRNSIAHGNYEINYDKALDHKNLNEIEFNFYDYPEEREKGPEFHVNLKASKLLQIVDGVQNRVNKQLENEKNLDKIARSSINFGRDEDDGER